MITYQNTHVIGDIGEAVAIQKFIEKGMMVSIPFSANCPYDLLVDTGTRIVKIQVKTTQFIKDNKMVFTTHRTNPFTLEQNRYSDEEIDYFFLYCIENKWCGLISVSDATRDTTIFLEDPKPNSVNQYVRKMYYDYSFEYKLSELVDGKIKKNNVVTVFKQKEQIPEKIVDHIEGRITRQELKDQLRSNTMEGVTAMNNVSSSAVRKWCIKMGIPSHISTIHSMSDDEWEQI